jgi:hypothetical protein
MLPLSTKDLVAYTPEHYEGQAGAPVYQLAVLSERERLGWQRDLLASGAQLMTDEDLRGVLRDGVQALLDGSARAEAEALLDRWPELQRLGPEAMPEDERRDLARQMETLEAAVRRHFPPYAEALANRIHWWGMARLLAFEHAVRGWEGLAVPFAARLGRVTRDAQEGVPVADRYAAGAKAIGLLQVSGEQRGN